MKKYWILILVLFSVVSCQEDDETKEEEHITENRLSLSGVVTSYNWDDLHASSFKLQLIKGEVDLTNLDENYNHPNAQIFITERNSNSFEFNDLQEEKYTIITTKKGYKTSIEVIGIKNNEANTMSIKMEKGNSGLTGKLQILSEDGNEFSEIRINHNNTISVFFYLYNGKGTDEVYNISYKHSEGYLGKSFIINNEVVHLYSEWIKEIKPRAGTLKPNEIKLIEVVIDPVVYLLKLHSSCTVSINHNYEIILSY